MCEVVNIKTGVHFDVYIGRHPDPVIGKWGNPFSHRDGTLAMYRTSSRKESIDKYETYLLSRPDLMEGLHELKGLVLGCFCHPKACHGHVLKKYVDRLECGIEPTLF